MLAVRPWLATAIALAFAAIATLLVLLLWGSVNADFCSS
jgi:hypothetical protein